MRFLSAFFLRRNEARHEPEPVPAMPVEPATAPEAKKRALRLPKHDPSVVEWTAPMARSVAGSIQAQALIALFQAEGRTGKIPHYELLASYPELAWVNGFVQLPEREILKAIGQICAKVRVMVDPGDGNPIRVRGYLVPPPTWAKQPEQPASEQGNVVPIGTKRTKIPSGSLLRAPRSQGKVASQKAARRKGGKYSADIREAVACQL